MYYLAFIYDCYLKFCYKCAAIIPDHVAGGSERLHDFLFRSRGLGRIREVVVVLLGRSRIPGTPFLCIVADRYHIVYRDFPVLIHMVAGMVADIHAILAHDGDGPGIDAMGLNPGTVNPYFISAKMLQISMGHLAAA